MPSTARLKSKSSPETALSLVDFLPFRLSVVANRVSYMIGNLIETQFDLMVPDWRILVTLNEFGSLAPNELSDRTSMDKARVSRAQRRLADLKLIETQDDPGDKRRKILRLTRLGRSVCDRLIPAAHERANWLLSDFTEAERQELARLLEKLSAKTSGLMLPDSPE